LAYEEQTARARAELERGFRDREETMRAKARETVDRETIALRSEFEKREAALESRRADIDKSLADRRQKLDDEFEKRRRESVSALAAEREATIAQLEARIREVEAEKARNGSWLAQKEAEIAGRYQEMERQLRQDLNMAKIEFASQYDEKVRRLAEEREALRRDYEQKLRDLEKRRQS
jgi:hypothetical protein